MYGKHSLAASAVLVGGPNGPRYYPETFSTAGAEAFADSSRASGVPAVVVPVELRMPDPGELLKMPRPQLWGVTRTDPFDVIAADVSDKQAGKATAGDEPREPAAPNEQTAGAAGRDDDDCLGDESFYYGSAEFGRLRDHWTVWTLHLHLAALPDLHSVHRELADAMSEGDVRRSGPDGDFATIIIGPGYGTVRVNNIVIWPDNWTVRTVIDEEVYPEDGIFERDGDPVDREQAKMMAERIAQTDHCGITCCPIITAAYRPAPKGGAR